MAELTLERLYDYISDTLESADTIQEDIATGIETVGVSADGFDDNQMGIEVIGTNGKTFTIIIIDEDEN